MVNSIMGKPSFLLDITLLNRGYDYEDLKELMEEPFCTIHPTRIGFQWYPSAVGSHFIEILLLFGIPILSSIASGYFSEIGVDLQKWTKSSLKRVLKNKEGFDDSRIYIKFDDTDMTIYTNDKEDIFVTMENIEKIVDIAIKQKHIEKNLTIEISDIRKELTK